MDEEDRLCEATITVPRALGGQAFPHDSVGLIPRASDAWALRLNGQGGIRTHGTLSRTQAFQACREKAVFGYGSRTQQLGGASAAIPCPE